MKHMIYDILLIDVIGKSTSCILSSTAETVLSRHLTFAMVLQDVAVNTERQILPIPDQMLRVMIQVNVLRAQQISFKLELIEHLQPIIHTLDNFQHSQWADSVALYSGSSGAQAYNNIGPVPAGQNASDILPWRALAKCIYSCTVIYVIHSICGFAQSQDQADDFTMSTTWAQSLWERSELAYRDALDGLLFLFEPKNKSSETGESGERAHMLHKFVLWPMVITGTYAVVAKSDRSVVERLSSHLEDLGRELGTYSMSDGAKFLRGLWIRTRNTPYVRLGWNDIYEKNPLFMM